MAKREKSIEELDRELAALEEELKALQSGGAKAPKAAASVPAPAEEAPKKKLLGRFARKEEPPALAPVASAETPAAEPVSAAVSYRWERDGRVSRRLVQGDVAPVRILRVLDGEGRVVSEGNAPEPDRAPRVAALASRVPSIFKRKRSGGGDG